MRHIETKPARAPASAVARVADVVIGCAACALFAYLVYVLYRYYWPGTRSFASAVTGPILVIGLTVATGLLVAGLTAPAPIRINSALALCSVAFCVYSVEAVVSAWSSLPSVQQERYQRQLAAAASARGREFDLRTKAEVVADLRARHIDAVPSMHPKGLLKKEDGTTHSPIVSDGTEMLPLASVSNRVTVVCNEGGEYVTYTSDEHGFHNPTGVWHQAPVDLVVLGDSFVQGWCVPAGRDFVSLIRQRYPSTVSLGIEGDGPLTMLATLREYGERLAPRIVVWCYFEANDIDDLTAEGRSPLLRRYLSDSFSQHLVERQPEIDRALDAYIADFIDENSLRLRISEIAGLFSSVDGAERQATSILKLTALRSRLGLLGGKEREGGQEEDAAALRRRAQSLIGTFNLLRQTLLEAKALAAKQRATLYFAYLPARDRYDSSGAGPNPDRDTVLNIAKDIGLPIIDLGPVLAGHADPLGLFPFRLADHYNEEGHRLVADTILAHLTR
jgi:hypothetical protein